MSPTRARAARLPPDTRRGLIVDAAEALLVEHDPLLVTFEQVATAAGVSRALVHTYLGDRRGLLDAVQARIISRLETWVGHGLVRATTREERLRALVHGLLAYVEAERDAWGVLAASGGFDHAGLHHLRSRWTMALSLDDRDDDLAAQAAVAALLGGAGGWVGRGTEPDDVIAVLTGLLTAPS